MVQKFLQKKCLKQKLKIYNPLIIAEIGNNFEGNLKIAKKLLLLAKAGVDAVKIQIIKPLKFFHK